VVIQPALTLGQTRGRAVGAGSRCSRCSAEFPVFGDSAACDHFGDEAYQRARQRLDDGSRPSPQSTSRVIFYPKRRGWLRDRALPRGTFNHGGARHAPGD
jgi:hypothetical protein